MTLFAGLDLGQSQDFTALTLVEQTQTAPESRYVVRGLRRWPLGTGYPEIVRDVHKLVAGMDLVIDGTGCGRPVVDMFKGTGQRLVPVTIHGGQETTRDPKTRYWKVPKRELAGTVNALLQGRRLEIVPTLADAVTLTHELRTFKPKISASGHDSYGAAASGLPDDWRGGPHDDLVLATALVLWYVERGHREPMATAVPRDDASERGNWRPFTSR